MSILGFFMFLYFIGMTYKRIMFATQQLSQLRYLYAQEIRLDIFLHCAIPNRLSCQLIILKTELVLAKKLIYVSLCWLSLCTDTSLFTIYVGLNCCCYR